MILVDQRIGSNELAPLILKCGVKSELAQLEFADCCFEGHGPNGDISIGVERKTLGDMLNCIDDNRYAAHQRPGMAAMYARNFLIIEGIWACGVPPFHTGILMTSRGDSWYPFRYRSQRVMYSKLYRYLITISLSGVTVTYSRDLQHTAINICEIYHYFQKKWTDHTSLQEIQKLAIPQLVGEPSLVRKWAAQLNGVGVKYSLAAEKIFRSGINLARAGEEEWLRVPGLGVRTAQQIVREIWKQ